MKKLLSILLALLMLAGIGAIAASAEDAAADAALPTAIRVHKGFAKHNADFFKNLKKLDGTSTFSAPPNGQFTIDMISGKMTFQTGLASIVPIPVTVTSSSGSQTVLVTTYYEWYEYFVIVFAAGLFWIAAVNN